MGHFRALSSTSDSHSVLFPKSFRPTLVQTMKWAAAANDIPTAVVNTHSLRAGGATALFSAGVDWITIQRWGRWKSFAFHDYIRRDYSGFMDLGIKIAATRGLNKFLVDVAPSHKRVRFDNPPTYTNGSLATEASLVGLRDVTLAYSPPTGSSHRFARCAPPSLTPGSGRLTGVCLRLRTFVACDSLFCVWRWGVHFAISFQINDYFFQSVFRIHFLPPRDARAQIIVF